MSSPAPHVRVIASPHSWVEGEALRQLEAASRLPGMRSAVGLPDLHPGKGAPVGAAFASEGVFYPCRRARRSRSAGRGGWTWMVCEDRDLLFEEAPPAYKAIDRVVQDLVDAGLVRVVATLAPVLTYKTRGQGTRPGR